MSTSKLSDDGQSALCEACSHFSNISPSSGNSGCLAKVKCVCTCVSFSVIQWHVGETRCSSGQQDRLPFTRIRNKLSLSRKSHSLSRFVQNFFFLPGHLVWNSRHKRRRIVCSGQSALHDTNRCSFLLDGGGGGASGGGGWSSSVEGMV